MTSGEGTSGAFLTATEFEAAWRPLSATESLWAARLLEAAGRWIRSQYLQHFGHAIDDDDPRAITVSIDVVKNAMETGRYAGQTSFSRTRTEGPRSKGDGGTFAAPGGALVFDDWHKEQLGLPTRPQPRYRFDGVVHDARY